MDIMDINRALAAGDVNRRGLFPRLSLLAQQPYVFQTDFGLEQLPTEPGVLIVRGPRQYGKSTWLEGSLRSSIETFGPGSAYYLNGDVVRDERDLVAQIRTLVPLYTPAAAARRLFIDEITAVRGWEKALKAVIDAGELQDVLVVTTGSNAADLRRGSERLPGRKGRLARTDYIFLPISYREFHRVCGDALQANTLRAYLLAGGAPLACAECAATGALPPYVVTMVRDWVDGECARSGRSRAGLRAVLDTLFRYAGSPVAQNKIAREAAMANNTVAAGYLELLRDLGCVALAYPWERSGRILRRKPAKVHFVNLLIASAWHASAPRTIEDIAVFPDEIAGQWLEWLVAQELWRRRILDGNEIVDELLFWQGGGHEVDFVDGAAEFIEVKHGRAGPLDFAWFPKVFPGRRLVVVTPQSYFDADAVVGRPIDSWLLKEKNEEKNEAAGTCAKGG